MPLQTAGIYYIISRANTEPAHPDIAGKSSNRIQVIKMKRIIIAALLAALILTPSLLYGCDTVKAPALFTDSLGYIDPDPDTHVKAAASGDPRIIYAPPEELSGYRYGPSIIYYADGSCDGWFSTPGYGGEWDWITYRHSEDGVEWGPEKVVLTPNADSMDKYSCCDPGVIYFGGWYYLGYTSTIESANGGVNNNVYVARSRRPDGPYEKWNGSGWGGDPAPIVYYNEYDLKYGAGEPSFVIARGKLYVYYSWSCSEGSFTKVSVTDTEDDWPARLEYAGTCYARRNSQDSSDVVYLEEAGKFLAFSTERRFSANSGIAIFESEDGVNFTQTCLFKNGLYTFCHNMGIAHRPDGHIRLIDDLFVGYAFSNGAEGNWGKWATAVQRISLELYNGSADEVLASAQNEAGVLCDDYFAAAGDMDNIIGIACSPRLLEFPEYADGNTVTMVWLDNALRSHEIKDTKNIRFSGYDKSLIRFKGSKMYVKGKQGVTTVTATYKGLRFEFKVYVRKDYDEIHGYFNKQIAEFRPVVEEYTIDLADRHTPQLRGYVRFTDNTWGDAFNGSEAYDQKRFPITYTVSEPGVIDVNERGVVSALAAGSVDVTVTINGPDSSSSFTVKVNVTDSSAGGIG